MSYWYNWLSWWCANDCSKHVENWNKCIRKKNCASSWLFTKKWIQQASKWPNVSVCIFRTSSRKSVCLSVCLSVCPRFPIRVKSTMADNLIERATWPVDLSRCLPISTPWEFVTQYDGNWGDVSRLSHLCTSFSSTSFPLLHFFFPFLLRNTTIFMALPWGRKSLLHTKYAHGVPVPSTPRRPNGRTVSLSHYITLTKRFVSGGLQQIY